MKGTYLKMLSNLTSLGEVCGLCTTTSHSVTINKHFRPNYIIYQVLKPLLYTVGIFHYKLHMTAEMKWDIQFSMPEKFRSTIPTLLYSHLSRYPLCLDDQQQQNQM